MNPSNLTVRHTPLSNNKLAEGAVTLDKIVAAGAQCPAVQNDPLAKQALANLGTKVTALDELLEQPHAALLDARGVVAHDVHVVDHGDRLGLLAEPGLGLRGERELLVEDLQRLAPAVGREDLVQLRDVARGHEAQDLVLGEVRAGLQDRHGGAR
jgi:hypothetical protein